MLSFIDIFANISIKAGLPPKEANKRAGQALVDIQGSLVVAKGLDDFTPFKNMLERSLRHLFYWGLAPKPPRFFKPFKR